jgi:hypothetical protein
MVFVPMYAMPDNSLQGPWVGQIQPDRDKLMRAAKLPEHRELLSYAIKRLEQSHVTLNLNSDGSFDYVFDDGYAADRTVVSGLWNATKSTLLLTIGQDKRRVEKLPILAGGKHITTNYNDIDGVPIIFTRH